MGKKSKMSSAERMVLNRKKKKAAAKKKHKAAAKAATTTPPSPPSPPAASETIKKKKEAALEITSSPHSLPTPPLSSASETISPPSPHPTPSLPGMGKSRASRRRQRQRLKKRKEAAAPETVAVGNLEKPSTRGLISEKSSTLDRGLISDSEELYPNLFPHFPKYRETLSLDGGFDQTPTLKKILAHYADEYVPSARQIVSHSLRLDSKVRLKMRDIYSNVASSVVAVSSFFGVERKVDCSGFIVDWSSANNEGTILTSARVLCNPKTSCHEFHLIVRMADGTLFLAKEDHVDFYHNILTLKVKSKAELNALDLTVDVVGRLRGTGLVERVVALGRSFYGYSLLDYVGELDQEYPSFGCSELLRSSCYASQICEGGPLITDTGDIVGVSFFGNGVCAHVLPTHIILSCLESRKSFGTVTRPWFGFSVIDLKQAHFQMCEKLHLSHMEVCVLVNEVFKGSLADKNDVRSHDLIVSLNGTLIESAHQYFDLLSGGVTDSSDSSQSFVVCIDAFGRSKEVSFMDEYLPVDDMRFYDYAFGRSKEVSFMAEYLPVDDMRFYDCWPQVEGKEWCREKVGSQKNPLFCWPPSLEEETC